MVKISLVLNKKKKKKNPVGVVADRSNVVLIFALRCRSLLWGIYTFMFRLFSQLIIIITSWGWGGERAGCLVS